MKLLNTAHLSPDDQQRVNNLFNVKQNGVIRDSPTARTIPPPPIVITDPVLPGNTPDSYRTFIENQKAINSRLPKK